MIGRIGSITICAYEKDRHAKGLCKEFLGDEEGHLNCLKEIQYYVGQVAYLATLTGK
jgi:bacterioferritin (cytochrome b1)